MRFIIHLKVENLVKQKKESKNDVQAARQSLNDIAKKTFEVDIKQFIKNKEITILKDVYTGQTFTTAVYVDLKKEKYDELRNELRKLDIVDMIELDFN